MVDPLEYAALSQLITRIWSSLERGAYDEVAALLTDDCRWERGGRMRVGRDAIRASFEERPAGRTVRHQVTNLMVDQEGEDVVCSYLVTAFSSEHAPEKEIPFSTVTPHLVAELADRCRREVDGFRVSEVNARILFRK